MMGSVPAARLVPAWRAALSDLFLAVGPEAETVLPGWRAEELLAHLLVRERQPHAAVGIVAAPLASVTERAMRGYAKLPWSRRVELLRDGPPPWSPFRIGRVDEQANLAEFVVHYADLARAQPGWRPVALPEEVQRALWERLRSLARPLYRRAPVGVLLRDTATGGGEIHARRGPGRVTVLGAPHELLLHAFGREHAQVELEGVPADVRALRDAPRGL